MNTSISGKDVNKKSIKYIEYKCEYCDGLHRLREDYEGSLRCETCGGGLLPVTTINKTDLKQELKDALSTKVCKLYTENEWKWVADPMRVRDARLALGII